MIKLLYKIIIACAASEEKQSTPESEEKQSTPEKNF